MPNESLSLYLKVPFCRALCWFCGCHTKTTRRYAPVAAYAATLSPGTELIAALVPEGLAVRRQHWCGGSPTMIAPEDWVHLDAKLQQRFDIDDNGEIGIEIDPRTADEERLAA